MIDRKSEARNFIILLTKLMFEEFVWYKVYMEVLISSRNQRKFLCTINCKCLYNKKLALCHVNPHELHEISHFNLPSR